MQRLSLIALATVITPSLAFADTWGLLPQCNGAGGSATWALASTALVAAGRFLLRR